MAPRKITDRAHLEGVPRQSVYLDQEGTAWQCLGAIGWERMQFDGIWDAPYSYPGYLIYAGEDLELETD